MTHHLDHAAFGECLSLGYNRGLTVAQEIALTACPIRSLR
jgi:hypothetical protein